MTPELLAEIQRTLAFKYDGTDSLHEEKKRAEILAYAERYDCRVFVETGTNRGDTLEAVREFFDDAYSIEIGPTLYEAAQRRFADFSNVHLLLGDAREVLSELIHDLPSSRVIFYLDAHCQYDDASPEGKAQGTSVPAEIQAISKVRPDTVVLIDDARLFSPSLIADGVNKESVLGTWPALAEMLQQIETLGIWDVDLKDDLIRLVPKS